MKTGFRFIVKRESGQKVVVSSESEDLGIDALVELFEAFALAAGYSQSAIDQYLKQ